MLNIRGGINILTIHAAGATNLVTRCAWPNDDERMIAYHDREWGVPVHDDRTHFEYIILDGAQAGLSWKTVLYKREGYRNAFADFDPRVVARYDDEKIQTLLQDPSIVRNRLKVAGAVKNARAFLDVQAEYGSFDAYIWQFVEGEPIQNTWKESRQIPAVSAQAQAMSKDLKARGFTFVGPTICYAYMQAAGMVNDHTTDCFRHAELHNAARP
jgi:DNA-3-methyladenine glycosylase I